jgi:GNAT superfamily N-acetyltransferase
VLTRLPDGTPLYIRPIRPDDKSLLESGLERLSEASRYKRFLGPKHRFTEGELRYLTELDGIDHVAYVALRGDAPKELVAVARLVRSVENPAAAEIAVTVCDDFQRRGVGTLLGNLLATAARDRGIRWLTATMSAENVGAHRLFNHVSTQLREWHDGPVDELWADLAFAA